MAERLWTVAEVAERFQVSPTAVRKWMVVHDWPRVQVGRTTRFTEAQLTAIAAHHTVGGSFRLGYPGERAGLTNLSAARLHP